MEDESNTEQDECPIESANEMLIKLIGTRRGKLGVLTRKLNETKALMQKGDVEKVVNNVDVFNATLNEFNQLHKSVQVFLSDEERESDQMDWYEPKISAPRSC